ncbi:hypothetical protein ED733_004547 [Metarhizium rileyi]|uniref:DUF7918 domain-containing protein n=1 Tax=Metarhizium rileyi (strain RCEF 4871) TaxID=1649241 RepID=A0A5C6G8V0_METRR|nr:hypothetical protein ED733_004547 [Metarhizium rileyi]
MAVISTVPGIDISVHVNGEVAQEYPPPCQLDGCMSSVPSNREIFAINAIALFVYIDGHPVGSRLIHRKSGLSGSTTFKFKDELFQSDVAGLCVRQSFSFSPISTVEEAASPKVKRDVERAKDLGSILVKLSTCCAGQMRPWTPLKQNKSSNFALAEKAMKGRELSHGTSYIREGMVSTCRHARLTYNLVPLGQYIFQYRSRERTYYPPNTTASWWLFNCKELSSMPDRYVRLLSEEMPRIKREKEVKQETLSYSFKRTIDLTEDSLGKMNEHRGYKILKQEDGTDFIDLTE